MKLPVIKNFIAKRQAQGGFTMIELLVVISILGVLAVAVLSSINPLEQINKGRDTRSRSDAGELLGAVERYAVTNEAFPWGPLEADSTSELTGDAPSAISTDLDELVAANEVKETFIDRLVAEDSLSIYHADGTEAVYVCFAPTSQTFQDQAMQQCVDNDGSATYPAAACPGSDYSSLPTSYNNELICIP